MSRVQKRQAKLRVMVDRIMRLHFFRFLLVGSAGFGLSIVVLWLLHGSMGMDISWATLLTCEAGLLWNFVFHQNWTYNSVDHHHKSLGKKLLQFHASSWSGVVILTALETVAVKTFHFEYLLSFVVAGSITMLWNFFWTKYFIFRARTPKINV